MEENVRRELWPGWETVRLLGRGSFGAVYEIRRRLGGEEERAAVKWMSVPRDEQEIRDLRLDGYDNAGLTEHFAAQKDRILREYGTMAKLKGCGNIVYCDDLRTQRHADGLGWDIFLKMELLTPLMVLLDRQPSETLALRLGRDIARGLSACHREKVLHRDVKPQNIFVNRDGTFKLGDFGVARTMEGTGSASIRTGTFRYMAPEVYNGEHYGPKADQYSLGLVLYWLLNERRSPFLPTPPALPRPEDEERARARRFRGEPLPPPVHGSEELKRIVLRACAFDPKDRYASAEELLRELDRLAAAPRKRESGPAAAKPAETGAPAAPARKPAAGKERERMNAPARPAADLGTRKETRAGGRKKPWIALAAVLLLALLAGAGLLLWPRGLHASALRELEPESAALLPEGSSCVGYYSISGRASRQETVTLPVNGDLEGKTVTLWLLTEDGQQKKLAAAVQNGRLEAELPGGSRVLLLAPTAELSDAGWEPWQDALPEGRLLDERAQALWESRVRVRETCFSDEPMLAGWDAEGMAEVDYGPWSPWQLTEIRENENMEVETGTLYRFRSRETTDSHTPLGEDWELQNTESEYGDWGAWSDWSESARGQSDTCSVQTKTQYRWVKEAMQMSIPEAPDQKGWRAVEWGAWADDEAAALSSAPGTSPLERVLTETRTLYRFQERTARYTYTYVRWGEWSDWSPEPAEDTEERQTEQAPGWRSREIRRSYSYGAWSPWQLTEIGPAEDLDVETGTVYRFRERESVVSQAPLGEDWELQNTESEYGDWGTWSDWSESARGESDTCSVQTMTQYRWVKQSRLMGDWNFDSAGAWADDEASAMAGAPNVESQPGMTTGLTQYRVVTETRTLYRFRERSAHYTYTYARWGEWSDWSPEPAEETENRQVEQATGWRSRSMQAQQGYRYSRWGDWSDWQQLLQLPEEQVETESRLQYRCR